MPSSEMLRRVALVRSDISEEAYRLHHQGDKNRRARNNVSSNYQSKLLRGVIRLLVTANVVPSLSILVTLMTEKISSSETSAPTKVTRHNIPQDGIHHSHGREILKPYIALTYWALKRRRNVFPVRNELGFYIPEDGIIHSHRCENLKS
jgi:hypothetical protein